MKSMAYTAEEAKKSEGMPGDTEEDGGPKYPYGLSIRLDEDTLKKLGIAAPGIGEKLLLQALVEVTSVSQYQNQKDTDTDVCLQITDMELIPNSGSQPDPNKLYK